jgi:phospholipid/cholesterol/gamma-HCH transport system substrate-binding protein
VSDYEKAQRRRNFVVGAFVIIGLSALGWLIFKFRDLPIWMSELKSFKVVVQFQTAPGVQTDTPVRFCGYEIGRVTEVMAPQVLEDLKTGLRYHQTRVVMMIEDQYVNVPSNVEVKLMSRGLGSSYIELKIDPQKPVETIEGDEPKYLYDGINLQGSTGLTSEFFPEESQKKFEQLVQSFSSLIDNANDVLGDPDNKENLKLTLAHLSEATQQAKQTLQDFQGLSVAGTTALNKADVRIDELVASMVNTSDELGRTASELKIVLEKVNRGQGSASRIVNDGKLYENLIENTKQLQLLLEDLRNVITRVNEEGLRSVY